LTTKKATREARAARTAKGSTPLRACSPGRKVARRVVAAPSATMSCPMLKTAVSGRLRFKAQSAVAMTRRTQATAPGSTMKKRA
jgi:hypothetical protein